MKNLNYFPYERNKYYYGKLMTEQDFIQEQRYLNDKRRFVNRYLGGTGVVAGLKVVAVGEKSISVEAGAALDFSGREVIVDTPVLTKLSVLDGFEAAAGEGRKEYVYLCLEYDETGISPSLNVTAGGFSPEDRMDYDRVKEGYRLYLCSEEPDVFYQRPEALYEREEYLFAGDGIFIKQVMPAYIESGGEFSVSLVLENRGGDRILTLNLEEELTCAWFGEEHVWKTELRDLVLEKSSVITKTFRFRAMAVNQGEIRFVMKQEALSAVIGSRIYKAEQDKTVEIPVFTGDAWDEMGRRFVDGSAGRIGRHNYPQGIYLARIYLVNTNGVYMIDRVEQNPFRQYVESSQQLMGYISWLHKEFDFLRQEKAEDIGKKNSGGLSCDETSGTNISSGLVTIDLGIGGKRGQRYFSEDIFHGLGLGAVEVSLSICQENFSFSGSSEVFEELKGKAELAARLNRSNGSFVIGARLLEPSAERRLTVRWTAVSGASREELAEAAAEGRLFIKPGQLQMKVRESFYLEAETVNLASQGVVWTVKSKDGGTITEDGMYTAPNQPGIYEIGAISEENPGIGAAMFVIVRE